MFSRTIANNHKKGVSSHNAITFRTTMTQKEVVKRLLKDKVANFLKPSKKVAGTWGPEYSYDNDCLSGPPTYETGRGCCSFTKNSQQWYLFPISEALLANTGYTADDLVEWIKFLNTMKVGFKYLYLGLQPGTDISQTNWVGGSGSLYPTNEYHWVAVPKFSESANIKKAYLHWIALRYLINTTVSTQNLTVPSNMNASSSSVYKEKTRLAYYNIPRIAMLLHQEYNVPAVKAFMYAHVANPFYNYYGMVHSDGMNNAYNKPDVFLTPSQFKALWNFDLTSMNNTFAVNAAVGVIDSLGRQISNGGFAEIRAIKNLSAPYDHLALFKLADEGNWRGFIDHIENAYKLEKKKNNVKKKKTTRTTT